MALDCLDACRKAGAIDEARELRRVNDEMEAHRRMMLVSMGKIEEAAMRIEVAAKRETGLRPTLEIPLLAYHSWAAKFKLKDMEAGILHTTGYECWRPGSGFYEWWHKKNPRLRYKEKKVCQQSSIIVPATRWTNVREAAAMAVTPLERRIAA